MSNGWLKLHRKALDNPELREPDAFRFWFWLLANASHKPHRVYRGKGGRPIDLQPGQLVVSTANGLDGLSRKRVRTLLDRFSKFGMISVESRRDIGHTIAITKWQQYQHDDGDFEGAGAIQGAKHGPYNGQTKAKQRPTAQEGKEGKEGKEEDSDSSLRSESRPPEPPEPARDLVKAEPIDEAVAAYNRVAEQCGLPVAKKITTARRSKLRARLQDCGGLSGWVEALRKVAASSHCTGGNNRGWRADLDFLLQEQSFVRLMEGRYDDRSPKGRNGSFEAQMAELLQQAREYDDANSRSVHDGTCDLLRGEDPLLGDGLPAAREPNRGADPGESRSVVTLFPGRR